MTEPPRKLGIIPVEYAEAEARNQIGQADSMGSPGIESASPRARFHKRETRYVFRSSIHLRNT
jgi:hypothetical protein